MTGPLVDLVARAFGGDPDRTAAKVISGEVARLLNSKRISNSTYVIGEPYCPYKIPVHTDDFWCTVFVSDASYVLRASHRRPTKRITEVADFYVDLKQRPSTKLLPTTLLPNVSRAVGADVFVCPLNEWSEDYIAARLLCDSVLPHLRKIDFSAVSTFCFGPLRLEVQASLRTAPNCADQVLALRELLVAVFRDACRRQTERAA